MLVPAELRADQAFYSLSEKNLAGAVLESEAALRYQEQQTTEQIWQAEATLAATIAHRAAAPDHITEFSLAGIRHFAK